MAPTTISLARVLELKVPIAWQEAVEVAHALDDASIGHGLLTLEGALIAIDGTVLLAPPEPGPDVWISPLRLLGRLLEGVTAPPELRALVGADVDALSSFPSEGDGVAPKTLTLNWFTRPNGASLISRLAERGIAADAAATETAAPSRAVAASPVGPAPVADYWPTPGFAPPSLAFVPKPRQSEWDLTASPLVAEASAVDTIPVVPAITIQRLRDEVSQWPAWAERLSAVVWLRENFPKGQTRVIAAACAATFLMVVTAWAWFPTRPTVPVIAARSRVLAESAAIGFAPRALAVPPFASPSARKVAPAALSVATRPSRDRDVVASLLPPPESSLSRPGTSIAPASNRSQSNGFATDSASVESAAALSMAAASGTAAAPPAATPAPAPARASSDISAAPPAPSVGRSARAAALVDRRIYSAADEGIEPPSMLRLQMPSERKPDSDAADSWIEVVVDERGQVAQVRLHSSNLSLNDRMIVSAAKAWQFQPAMKDGKPVKYVLRMPVVR